MGILSLLRNAFGRSRKGRDADATASTREPAPEPTQAASPEPEPEPTPTAAAEPKPAPEPAPSVVDDLVSAAFDNVTVPKPTPPANEPAPKSEPTVTTEPKPETEPEPAAAAEPEPEPAKTPEPEPVAAAEPDPAAEAEPAAAAEPEPALEAEPDPAATAEPEPVVKAEPEAVAPAEPEPTAAAEPQPEPEPAAEAEPEPVVKAEPEAVAPAEPEPTAAAEPEPALEAEPDPAATAEPEVDVQPEPEPEPAPEPEPVSAAAQAHEPAAADGYQAPQGPPAADDESRTGGAGGNETPAEGEAEADKTPEPAAATLAHIKTRAPSLTTAYKAAAAALKKHDLTGTRAKVYLVLDRSASMRPYYKDGSAQALGEQALALAANLDPEATVHVTFFSTELDGTGELTLDEYENKIDDLHAGLGRMGRTSYHAAVEEIVTHYEQSGTADPALVIFQTDGAPDAKTPATQSLTDAAKKHPAVFFSFVAFGDPENKAFDYLRKLKTDNTAHFLAGETPRELTDKELYEGVLANWRP